MKYIFNAAIGRGWIEHPNGSIYCFLKDDDHDGITEIDPTNVDRDMFLESSFEPQITSGEIDEKTKESIYADLRRQHGEYLFRNIFDILIKRNTVDHDVVMHEIICNLCEEFIEREGGKFFAYTYIAECLAEQDVDLEVTDKHPTLKKIIEECS